MVAEAAAVVTEAHITPGGLAILDAPVPPYRWSLALHPEGGRAVADVLGHLLGLVPFALLGREHVACAPHLEDGRNQPVPFGGPGGCGEDPPLTALETRARRVKRPRSAEGGSRGRAPAPAPTASAGCL